MREHVIIWYNSKTLLPTNYIRENTKKYIPDFLIRNKENNTAYLVELKPAEFNDEEQIKLRTSVAENYIREQKLDWQFKVIYGDQINLSAAKHKKFMELRNRIEGFNFMRRMEYLDKKFNSANVNYFKTIPLHTGNISRSDYAKLVKFGDSGQ